MSIPEALRGAQAELARLQSPVDRMRRVAVYAKIIGAELLGTVAVIPFAFRAFMLHRSLPEARAGAPQPCVSLLRGARYANNKQRNTLDVYLPAGATLHSLPDMEGAGGQPSPAPQQQPVVLFVHGGVWATGEGWHYAPLATRLAQAGVVTAVMQYSLYPHALVPEMAGEVSAALSWTLDNAARLGGAPGRVTLAGHSAGAQLCAMALLQRGLGKGAAAQSSSGSSGGSGGSEAAAGGGRGGGDGRMPCRFVGMAGVYDLANHLEYERTRDVHELSTMARAVGGPANFAACSPAVVLAGARRRGGGGQGGAAAPSIEQRAGAPFYSRFELRGDAVAHRVGLTRPSSAAPQPATAAASAAAPNPTAAGAGAPAASLLSFSAEDAARLPPTLLQSSCADRVVPWHESAAMHWALLDAGAPCRSLVYNAAGHGDFVVAWRPLPVAGAAAEEGGDTAGLPDFAADLVDVVKGRVPGV
jgi:acetyl esterase/lipase